MFVVEECFKCKAAFAIGTVDKCDACKGTVFLNKPVRIGNKGRAIDEVMKSMAGIQSINREENE